MSNIATVQSVYEAFGRGDIPAILDMISDDVAWEDWSDTQPRRTPACRGYGRAAGARVPPPSSRPLRRDRDPRLPAAPTCSRAATRSRRQIKIDFTVKATGERVHDEEIHLWTFDDDGQVAALRHYARHREAHQGCEGVARRGGLTLSA